MRASIWIWSVLAVLVMATAAIAWSVAYDVAADEPHSGPLTWLLRKASERSLEAQTKRIEVPNLAAPDLVAAGGPAYDRLCASCHGKPGREPTPLARGLSPPPPDLTQPRAQREHTRLPPDAKAAAARAYWIIKHGVRWTGMPAWGASRHDDQEIWAMVAFLGKLPELTPEEYRKLTTAGDEERETGGKSASGVGSAGGRSARPDRATPQATSSS